MRSASEKRREIGVTVAENARTPRPETVECLAARLVVIRERIWRLQAMFAVSLSHDCAIESNQYLHLFQTLALKLKEENASLFDNLVRGHESLLLPPSVPVKQTIPLETQRLCELRWDVYRMPARYPARRATETIPDGLGWML